MRSQWSLRTGCLLVLQNRTRFEIVYDLQWCGMAFLETNTTTAPYRKRCEDRVAVIQLPERTVIVVADGAGGVGYGEMAAQAVVDEVQREHTRIHSADQWVELLHQIDCRISLGESTAVVVDARPYGIAGASVGDSEAWIVRGESIVKLTLNQKRKPLLGSGSATAIPFMHAPLDGLLLVATDGFCNYIHQYQFRRMMAEADFWSIPRQCVEMVRLASGELWDDVAIVAARVKPRHQSRRRISL